MRPTVAHLREAAIVGGLGLTAFAVMHATYLIGYDSPFMPGAISLIFVALWIFLLRRYGPQGPVDPHRQHIWFLSGLAACGALAVLGLVAALWIGATHAGPSAPCPVHCDQPS
jgi:drug/metabolite transporter (DMT)-like permease